MSNSPSPNRTEARDDETGLLASVSDAITAVWDPVERGILAVWGPVSRVLLAIRRSFLLFIAVVGVVLIAIGAVLDGLFAAMFGIWGVTALVCAGVGFLIVELLQLLDT